MGKWRLSRGQGHFGHVLLPIISQTLLDNTAATAAAGCDDIDNSPVDAGKCRRILLPLPFLGQGVQVARVAQGRTVDDSAGEDVAECALNVNSGDSCMRRKRLFSMVQQARQGRLNMNGPHGVLAADDEVHRVPLRASRALCRDFGGRGAATFRRH